MSALKTILREIWGLFVDDGTFAIVILLWLAVCALAMPHLAPRMPAHWSGPILFGGLALILLEDTLRFARNKRP